MLSQKKEMYRDFFAILLKLLDEIRKLSYDSRSFFYDSKMSIRMQSEYSSKDYSDIDALIHQAGIDLKTLIAAGSIIYGAQFNPQLTFKALTYFKGGDLESLSPEIQSRLVHSLKNLEWEKIPERILELKQYKEEKIKSSC